MGRTIGGLLVCASFAAGCSGTAFEPGNAGVGTGGDTGTTLSTGGASNGGGSGPGATTGVDVATGGASTTSGASTSSSGTATGGTGGQGSTEQCAQTHDQVTVQFTQDGTEVDPNPNVALRDMTFDMAGPIVAVDAASFSIEGCPDGSACLRSEIDRFTVEAPGLDLTQSIKVGALAHVSFDRHCPWGCVTNITVKSLADFQGATNPYPAASGIYLAANDGGGTPSDVPYDIQQMQQSCPNPFQEGGCGGTLPTGLYLLRFTSPSTQAPLDVPMGKTRWLKVGRGWLQVRNLRSYNTGWCDDYWEWAHWAIDGTPLI